MHEKHRGAVRAPEIDPFGTNDDSGRRPWISIAESAFQRTAVESADGPCEQKWNEDRNGGHHATADLV
jgi:hypothetical protein